MTPKNKLIAAGAGRLKKAADSQVDPAVPAELQKAPLPEASVFSGGRLLTADDVSGSPEEQLSYVKDRLAEIDTFGRRVDDYVVLNKGLLLEVARDRELHAVAGHTNFSQWAAALLDVEPKYVFELLQDAARIRAVGQLGEETASLLTRASARKVIAGVIETHGVEHAEVVVRVSAEQAKTQGRSKPTAAMLRQAATELESPKVPHQQETSPGEQGESADPDRGAVTGSGDLAGAATAVGRAYSALAPKRVAAAHEADPEKAGRDLAQLRSEVDKLVKRLSAAEKAIAK
ncbi:hypothetical protein [Streptomyces bohaiensis]|uniref:DUF3102 domain-containing protein n=1 Tax=Streptomyces bohaiensis TaxID=1431344 RepID=A0ABX1C5P9_9ACTN|nr:hypothetical protein [Streptomyces bohaiensis]NJQ13526.1 hypothetical protein [Streptomyces bohaiensis]